MESRGIVGQTAAGNERAFVHRLETRPVLDRFTIGQTFHERDGERTVRVRQVHRKERRVTAVDGAGARLCLTFAELRRLWRQTDEAAA